MQIAIIGCGAMGSALAQALSRMHTVFLYDHHMEKTKALEKDGYGIACHTLKELFPHSEAIIIAVKSKKLQDIARDLSSYLLPNQIILSVVACASLECLQECFPENRVVRMMPNLAIKYSEGMIGVSVEYPLTEKERKRILEVIGPCGKIYWIDEERQNAFTVLAASGPGFLAAYIEAMIDSGIFMGFSSEMAKEIILEMVKATALLLEKSKKHPGVLKWEVASPQGITISGLRKLEVLGTRGAIMDTFLSAYEQIE